MTSYFKRYYLDDVKLAQRALLEFHRALKSGRMIAFTGAMTTENCGYGSWDELIETYARLATTLIDGERDPADPRQELAKAIRGRGDELKDGLAKLIGLKGSFEHAEVIETVLNHRKDREKRFDARVALGIMEEVVIGNTDTDFVSSIDFDDRAPEFLATQPIEKLELAIAEYFRKPYRQQAIKEGVAAFEQLKPTIGLKLDVVKGLLSSLGIRRFATLNYDLELERQTMLGPLGAEEPFKNLLKMHAATSNKLFDWEVSSGRIRRVLTNGQAIESDILHRERIDRMIEFAIGADDVDRHILHLHGRACTPGSMILSYRDYDKLYRRNDLYKLPFEFAQRIMIGGNPILFIGLGMSEQEVNQSLQDFVSASPYQRMAPTFLLWNYDRPRRLMTAEDWDYIQMQRLDRFHRLGVLTIFDVDLHPHADPGIGKLVDLKGEALKQLADGPRKAAAINNLCWLVDNIASYARHIAGRENFTSAGVWRTMTPKLAEEQRVSILWEVKEGMSLPEPPRSHDRALEILAAYLKAPAPSQMLCLIGSQGCGNGSLAYAVATSPDRSGFKPGSTLLINGAFSFDTDSMLDGIARFLFRHRDGGYLSGTEQGMRPLQSRGTYFTSLHEGKSDPLLIVISGMERFFSINGELLSAELDELISIAADGGTPGVTWILFGTERVADYMASRLIPVRRADEWLPAPRHVDELGDTLLPFERFQSIKTAFDAECPSARDIAPAQYQAMLDEAGRLRALAAARISGDSMELRESFYDFYLGGIFDQVLADDTSIARELLRTLAFIGLPAEIAVLVHAPRLRAKLKTLETDAARRGDIARVLRRLIDLKLVISIYGYRENRIGQDRDDSPHRLRYTLPRTLLSELRYRFSVPLSEAKLSTSFNMSLYIAQPVDGFIPEPDIHDELGKLTDALLGAYREEAQHIEPPQALQGALELAVHQVCRHERPRKGVSGVQQEGRYKVPLAQEVAALCGEEQAQRLRAALALVRGYYTTTDLLTLDVGDRLIREDRDGILLEHAERLDCLIDSYGKMAQARDILRANCATLPDGYLVEPLYPDELVWLHNERAVVRLAMGDLYEALASLDRAFEVNTRHVECDDRAHNWRRIRLNQITVDIEMGEIGLALRKIEEILGFSTERRPLREDMLAIAIAHGSRARVRHLQGDAARASADYGIAIDSLETLQESRARAYFLRLRAELGLPDAMADLTSALDLALTTRQMDIAYRIRIMIAARAITAGTAAQALDQPGRARAQRLLDEAMRYALQTDMHRVRVEAGAALGESRRMSGDYEGALRSVSDAIMVATRFGMELRKIWLRSLMARIMASRGHPITASNLARAAIKIASRRKYQHAIDHAEDTLVSIPEISAITNVIDASSRRQL